MAKQNTAQSFGYPLATLKRPPNTSHHSTLATLLFEVAITIAVHLTFPFFSQFLHHLQLCGKMVFVTFCGCDYFWLLLLLLFVAAVICIINSGRHSTQFNNRFV